MDPMTIIIWAVVALLVLFAVTAIARAIRIVPQATAVIVERLGKYDRKLTVTTLRNVIGSLDLEQTLTSRDMINGQLRGVLDEATGRWGIRVNRVELKAIDPPASVQDSMEKQMRAERDRRAAILNAEGVKQSQILTAEGEKQAQILRAEGTAQSAILESQGEARAILQVFDAIHKGNPDSKLLAYQYLQMLPEIAKGEANQMWVVPTELTAALSGIGNALGGGGSSSAGNLDAPSAGLREDAGYSGLDDGLDAPTLEDPREALRRAREEAEGATRDAEGATKNRSKEEADKAIAAAAEKAKQAQAQAAAQEQGGQGGARGLEQMPQQDQIVPDLSEQEQAAPQEQGGGQEQGGARASHQGELGRTWGRDEPHDWQQPRSND